MKIYITKQEIKNKFNLPQESEIEFAFEDRTLEITSQEAHNEIIVDFPELTAKEIIGDGKFEGHDFFWSDWFLKKPFYTKEKCRKGKKAISLITTDLGISGEDALKKDLLNFPEFVYLCKNSQEFRDSFTDYNWIWLSSKSGARLVCSGWRPGIHRLYVRAGDLAIQDDTLGVRPARCLE